MTSSGQEGTRVNPTPARSLAPSPVQASQQANGVAEETVFDRQLYEARV